MSCAEKGPSHTQDQVGVLTPELGELGHQDTWDCAEGVPMRAVSLHADGQEAYYSSCSSGT